MCRFLMRNKAPFQSCLIITLWTLKSLAHMDRFLMSNMTFEFLVHKDGFPMSNKAAFLSCLVSTLLTLKGFTHVNCLLVEIEACFLTSLTSFTYLAGIFASIIRTHQDHYWKAYNLS